MDLLLLLFLFAINGMFAMSEIAIVSSRKARLQRLADEDHPGAQAAIELHDNPSRFLSVVQVGITLIGILVGAIGDDALVAPLTEWLKQFPLLAHYAEAVALAAVVMALTYFSVIIGELVPKQLGLLAPERIASFVAGPMNVVARASRPFVTLFSASGDFIVRLTRLRKSNEPPVTDEEIKVLMEQGAEAGVFHASERQLVANVLHLDDQAVRAIMTPRHDVDALDLDEGEDTLRKALLSSDHSRFVVYRGDYSSIVGILHTSDLLRKLLAGESAVIADSLRPAHYVPDTITLSQLLENLRRARTTIALVVDEYSDFQGIVTLRDVIEAIVGDVTFDTTDEVEIVQREDGSWLVDGIVSIERLKQMLDVTSLPGEDDGHYHTTAGFVLHMLGHIPHAGEHFIAEGYRFEVVDMDGHRIDKLLIALVD